MTNVNFSFSDTLSAELQKTGVYAYAVAFSGATYVSTSSMVLDGVVSTDLSMPLPTSFPSGVVYVVIQQGGTPSTASAFADSLQSLSAFSPTSAAPSTTNPTLHNYSYQLFEATLTPSVFDQGDISAVNTFAFPASYSVVSDGQTFSLGFAAGQTGNNIYAALGNAQVFTGGSNALSIGPAASANTGPFPASDWYGYITALKGNAAGLANITLVVPFAGSPLQAGGMLSQYGVKYVETDPVFGNDFFWLVPNTMNGATNTDWIYIPAEVSTTTAGSLADNIYVQPGPLLVYPDNGSGQPSTTPLPPPAGGSFTPNNADGAVAKYFVAGFDAGYWGGSGTSANPIDPTISDLSKTWNWNVNYAYNASLTSTAITYSNPLGSGPGSSGGNNRFYDPWAQEIQAVSNAYGYSYTDLVSVGGVNPQLTLRAPSQNGGAGGSVADINISLFSNSEVLPATAGFQTAPIIYVPPTGTSYSSVNNIVTGNANMIGFAFQFGLSSLNFAPDPSTPVSFKFYAPSDSQAGADGFVALSLPVLQDTVWNILTVEGGPGSWSLASNAGSNAFSGQNGQFNIYNIPTTSDGSTGWYQLVFGDSDSQTVYNLYASNVDGVFQPISGNGSNPNNFVIDHGVQVTQATDHAGYFTLNFAPGANILYNIETLSPPGTIYGTIAADTLVGTAASEVLNGGPGSDRIDGGEGVDTAMTWSPSTNFTLRATAGLQGLTMQDKVGNQGTDSLISIEKVRFGDQTIDITSMSKTAAMAPEQVMKVVDLYTAGLGRAPDALGLAFWASRLSDGASVDEISKVFFGAPEAARIYSPLQSNPEFVDFVYRTALGRAPDAEGASFWINHLDEGHLQRTDFISSFIASVRRPDGGDANDVKYISNREAVGAHFALTQGLNNGEWAQAVVSNVDGSSASVISAKAQTDSLAAIAATTVGSELVMQIVGIAS